MRAALGIGRAFRLVTTLPRRLFVHRTDPAAELPLLTERTGELLRHLYATAAEEGRPVRRWIVRFDVEPLGSEHAELRIDAYLAPPEDPDA